MNCKHILSQLHIKLDKKISSLLQKQRPGFILQKNNSTTERTTLLGDVYITKEERNILNKGPSFAPAQKVNNYVRQQLTANILNLGVILRWKNNETNVISKSNTDMSEIQHVCPFEKSHTKFPPNVPIIEYKIQLLNSKVVELLNIEDKVFRDNITKNDRQALKSLKKKINNNEIRISVSDKGGEFTIINQSLDKRITMLHLSDVSTYKVTNKTIFLQSVKDVKTNWDTICQKQCVSAKFKETVDNAHPNCPVLYVLIKTHKMTEELIKSNDASKFSCRPIISG